MKAKLVPVALVNVSPVVLNNPPRVSVPVELRYNPVSPKKIPPRGVVEALRYKEEEAVVVLTPTNPLLKIVKSDAVLCT